MQLINPSSLVSTQANLFFRDEIMALNDPRQIAGLILWLDANDLNGVLNNGDLVTNWYDKSGYGHNAVQSNATYKPILYKDKWSGNSVLYTDNTTKHYMVITRTAALEPNYITLVCAYIYNGSTGGYILTKPCRTTNTWSSPYAEYGFSASYSDNTGKINLHTAVSTTTYKHAYATAAYSATWKYSTNLSITSYDGTASGILSWINNDILGMTNVTGPALTGAINYGVGDADISLFTTSHYWSSRTCFPGYTGEIMLFNSALSSENRTIIFNYLKAKYYGAIFY